MYGSELPPVPTPTSSVYMLPASLSTILTLNTLLASHNMLRSSKTSLRLESLSKLPNLLALDITFNQKCGHQQLRETIFKFLPSIDLKTTVCFPRPEGAFVGDSPADRDATLLRSQLEPWSTTALRRRIVADFGGDVLAPEIPRSEVMNTLLQMYANEKPRVIVNVDGAPIDPDVIADLHEALRSWSNGFGCGNKERTSVKAANYMILTAGGDPPSPPLPSCIWQPFIDNFVLCVALQSTRWGHERQLLLQKN